MRFIYILFMAACCIFTGYGQLNTSYHPNPGTYSVGYNEKVTFQCQAFPEKINTHLTLKVSIENASHVGSVENLEYSATGGLNQIFDVYFRVPSTQATIKIMWYQGSIGGENKIWKYNVGAEPTPQPTLRMSGPSEMPENSMASFVAYYSESTSATKYNWSVSGGLSITQGQGSNKITVKSGQGEGTGVINVSTNGLNSSRYVKITSSTLNISNQTITSNKDYSAEAINISNTTISNNATVNFVANNSIIIKPKFHAQQGTRVLIRATNTAYRSMEDNFFVNTPQIMVHFDEDLDNYKTIVRNYTDKNFLTVKINSVENTVDLIEVYSLSGVLMHRRKVSNTEENFDMSSCSNGIYIVRTIFKNGRFTSNKILLKK